MTLRLCHHQKADMLVKLKILDMEGCIFICKGYLLSLARHHPQKLIRNYINTAETSH